MTTGPLRAPSKCKSGRVNARGYSSTHLTTLWRWWSGSSRLRTLPGRPGPWKSTPKCTWICWRVWWSPGAIRWPVEDRECSCRTRRRPTRPKRPRLGFRKSTTTSFSSLIGPLLNPLDYFVWSYVENITNMTSHNTKVSLITAIHRLFTEILPALVEKACSQFWIRIEAVSEAEGSYIE